MTQRELRRELETTAAELTKVKRVLGLVTEERELLSDELQVRHHMVLHLAEGRFAAEQSAGEAAATAARAAEAAAVLQTRVAAAERLEAEAEEMRREKADMAKTMEEWKAKVMEALRDNRVKEQAHVQTAIEQRAEITRLKEAVDRVNFQLEAAKLKGRAQELMITTAAQTDETAAPSPPPQQGKRDSCPPYIPAPGSSKSSGALMSSYAESSNGGFPAAPSQSSLGTAGAVIHTPQLMCAVPPSPNVVPTLSVGVTPIMDPALPERPMSPLLPAEDSAARPPLAKLAPLPMPVITGAKSAAALGKTMIVTVHFGDAEGWTIDTKHRATTGMSVGELKAQVCEQINSRFGKSLDSALMCVKTHHSRAGRHVTLSEHRDMHSYAYFHRCVAEERPIKLQLESLKASDVM